MNETDVKQVIFDIKISAKTLQEKVRELNRAGVDVTLNLISTQKDIFIKAPAERSDRVPFEIKLTEVKSNQNLLG